MNKKGFTLVELLVVIAILALLIIITTFTILNILNRTRVEIEEVNVKRYLKDVENAIMVSKVSGEQIYDGTYYINNDSLGKKFPFLVESNLVPKGNDDYVVVEDGKIVKYKITSKNYVITDIGNYLESTVDDWINIKDYGAKGDGITDDTDAIKAAVNDINSKGGTLFFPYGVYLVSAQKYQDTILNISSDKKIIIEMNSSTIKLKENNYPHYNIFMINKASDVILKNGTLIGDRIKHDYTGYINKSRTHEFGYGVYVYYSKNVVISNMNISQMTGDAIINKTGTADGNTNYTLIENSDLSYCRRQGLSVLDTDRIEVNNVYIHHIGTFDGINGTAPKSGIDIEPASGTKVVNSIILNNVNIDNTESFGIIQASTSKANEFIISNSNIESPNFMKAKIFNTTLTTKLKQASVLKQCEINNSKILHYAEGADLYFSSVIENSIIEGLNKKPGNRIFFEEDSKITNSLILNFLGKTNETKLGGPEAGIYYRSKNEFINNLYDNVVIFYSVIGNNDYTFNDKNSTIKNSFVGLSGNQNVVFNNMNFEDVYFRTNLYNNGYNRIIYFNNSLIKDSSIKDSGKVMKEYNNTNIISDGEELEDIRQN